MMMSKIDPLILKHRFDFVPFPKEILLGIKILNFEVLCEDYIYRKVYGLEIGYIFLTFSYINIIIE